MASNKVYGKLSGYFVLSNSDCIVDPATTIAFPKIMHIPSNVGIPPLTLVGLGVRTVSFLGIRVYSVAFYADLNNPNLKVSHLHILPRQLRHFTTQIPVDMPGEEKIKHISQEFFLRHPHRYE
jgi:hypothetical protein